MVKDPHWKSDWSETDEAIKGHASDTDTLTYLKTFLLSIDGGSVSNRVRERNPGVTVNGHDVKNYAADRTGINEHKLRSYQKCAKALWKHFHPSNTLPRAVASASSASASGSRQQSAARSASTAASSSSAAIVAGPSSSGTRVAAPLAPPPPPLANPDLDPAVAPPKPDVQVGRLVEVRNDLIWINEKAAEFAKEDVETQLEYLSGSMGGLSERRRQGAREIMLFAISVRRDLPLSALKEILELIETAHPDSPVNHDEVKEMLDGKPVEEWAEIIWRRYHGHQGARILTGQEPTTYLGFLHTASQSALSSHLSTVDSLISKSSIPLPSARRAHKKLTDFNNSTKSIDIRTSTFEQRMTSVGECQDGTSHRTNRDGQGASLKSSVYNLLGLGRPSEKRKRQSGGGPAAAIGRRAALEEVKNSPLQINEEEEAEQLIGRGRSADGRLRFDYGENSTSRYADVVKSSRGPDAFTFTRSALILFPQGASRSDVAGEAISSLELVASSLFDSPWSLDVSPPGIVHRQSAPQIVREATRSIGSNEELVDLGGNLLNLGLAPPKNNRSGVAGVAQSDYISQHQFDSLGRDGPFDEPMGFPMTPWNDLISAPSTWSGDTRRYRMNSPPTVRERSRFARQAYEFAKSKNGKEVFCVRSPYVYELYSGVKKADAATIGPLARLLIIGATEDVPEHSYVSLPMDHLGALAYLGYPGWSLEPSSYQSFVAMSLIKFVHIKGWELDTPPQVKAAGILEFNAAHSYTFEKIVVLQRNSKVKEVRLADGNSSDVVTTNPTERRTLTIAKDSNSPPHLRLHTEVGIGDSWRILTGDVTFPVFGREFWKPVRKFELWVHGQLDYSFVGVPAGGGKIGVNMLIHDRSRLHLKSSSPDAKVWFDSLKDGGFLMARNFLTNPPSLERWVGNVKEGEGWSGFAQLCKGLAPAHSQDDSALLDKSTDDLPTELYEAESQLERVRAASEAMQRDIDELADDLGIEIRM